MTIVDMSVLPNGGTAHDIYEILCTPMGNGQYTASIPRPDPLAGENFKEKCAALADILGVLAEAADSLGPVGQLYVCSALAAAAVELSPVGVAAVLAGCEAGFKALETYGETLEQPKVPLPGGEEPTFADYICSLASKIVDRVAKAPVTLTPFARAPQLDVNSGPAFTAPASDTISVVVRMLDPALPAIKLCVGQAQSTITYTPMMGGSGITGTWVGPYQYPDDANCGGANGVATITLTDNNGVLTGTELDDPTTVGPASATITGTRSGSTVAWTAVYPPGPREETAMFTGTVTGSTITGTYVGGCSNKAGSVTFTLTKQ